MPLTGGYGYETVHQNIDNLVREGMPRDQAVAAAMAKGRVSYFKRFPAGALPSWLAFPRRYRMKQHYTKHGAPRFAGALENPASRGEVADLRRAAKLGEDFSGHPYGKVVKVRRRSPKGARLAIGPVTGIMYLARRDGETDQYLHRFAKDSRPLLVATSDGKTLELLGGAFRFTERGIVDSPVKVKRKR